MMQQPHAHLARQSHKEPPPHAPNAALLIDFDNVTMGIRSDLQTELKRLLQSEIIRGKVAVQRAYADWRRYPQYIVPLSESSIDLIFAPAYGSNKKNATDIRLAIDALELVFTRPEIGTFILLSGDSDFSSLVLKLKEYGKYVIGVGIRESSSDLLIQNCDEYYSYNELAGLTRESDATHEHHDPWELVVEAVKQMTAHNDVMRSDRLKQVMQEIDPSFNEKDIGFSRFSKFVVEAAHRGLVTLTKLDNGQYELSLGPDVAGAAAQPTGPGGREEAQGAPAPAPARGRQAAGEGRGRRGGSRSGSGSGSGSAGGGGGFSLGEAFGVLKQALGRLGAGDHAVSADTVRDTMVELAGGSGAPLEAERFPKLLRQAHDAEVIDLSKGEDGAYAVKLRPAAESPAEPAGADRGRATAADEPLAAGEPATSVAATSAAPGPASGVPSRSARFRRGSRGPRLTPPDIPKIGVVEVDPNFKPRIELVPVKHADADVVAPATPTPSAPLGRGLESGRGEHEDRRPRGGRGRGGGGGGGGSGGGAESAGGRAQGSSGRERDAGEREPGERGRSRRGGRGRGGRGRRGGGSGSAGGAGGNLGGSGAGMGSEAIRGERTEPREVSPADGDVLAARRVVPPKPTSEEPEGESFWSKVKRGLTGGG